MGNEVANRPDAGAVAPAHGRGQGQVAAGESWLDTIVQQMDLLRQDLERVADKTEMLVRLAEAVEDTLIEVDEESERVEAPTETRAAANAASVVGGRIATLAGLVARHCGAAQALTLAARAGMRPAERVQDSNRAMGAGPKLMATAR